MSFTSAAASVYESTLAGSDYLDAVPMRRDVAKANIGLGLGLPTEVLHKSFGASKSAGLGIYIDFENWDGLLVSPVPYTDIAGSVDELPSSSVSFMSESPPMLGTRRARHAPSQDSFWSEYSSLRTPSPSMLFSSYGSSPSPDDELVLKQSMLSAGYTLASTESISSGLNLLCLDDEELMGYMPPPEAFRPDAGVGLGLSLVDMEGAELVQTLHQHRLRDIPAELVPPNLFSYAELNEFVSPLLPHLTDRHHALSHIAHPKPRRALVGSVIHVYGWELDEEVDLQALRAEESSASSASAEACGLGFSSPFWESYAAILHGEA